MKKCRWLIQCSLFLFLCWQTLSAQYRFDSWTTDNGLPQNGVRAITQTPDGYLWFTTFDGLVRFDGVKFTVFDKNNTKGIINNRFVVVSAFEDGSVWAGTEAGDLTVYRDGSFISYSNEIIPDTQIFGFFGDADGTVLFETDKSIYKLIDDKFVFVRHNENDGTLKKIHKGHFAHWEIYLDKTLRSKDGAVKVYPIAIKNIDYYNDNIFEDENGDFWVGDFDKLIRFSVDGGVNEYGIDDGYPKDGMAHRFWRDADGSLWFATGRFQIPGVGLVRFKDGKFKIFGAAEGLSDNHIFSVFKDREGTTWLATDGGLNRLQRQIISSLSKANGMAENEVYPILRALDGTIYIGTTRGLSRYKDDKFSQIDLSFADRYNATPSIQSLWEDASGRLWVGCLGALFIVENGKVRRLEGLFDGTRTVSAIRSDRFGNVWLGTEYEGVVQYKDGKVVAKYSTKQGLPSSDVKAIYEAKDGKLWFGTYGGLSIAECEAQNVNCRIKTYTTKDGLTSNSVRSIYEDAEGTFWIGTYDGGLSRFKDGKFFNFNTSNGLFNNGVFATVEDERGNFWISSNKGIYRVNKNALNDFADGKITRYESSAYGKQDGMLSTECNGGRQPSAMKTKDGKIWFPTLEGVAIVDPNAIEINPIPPPVEIESVAVDRANVDFKQAVQIQPSNVYIDINYTSLSLIKSDQIHFRYKLEGLDKEWIDAGTRRTVNYTHLPPGEYVFRVIAANVDGVWNTEGKSIKIVVLAPFYKTWKFIVGLIFCVIGLGFLVYTYRIRQLKKLNTAQEVFSRKLIESQEKERKRIAQELHDGLGQNLLVIKNRALLGLAVNGKDKSDEQFGEIKESVTDALSEVRSIAYNLRPLHIERLGLTSTIEEMIEQVDDASGIKINCDIERIDNIFTSENEINFYRIVQECLNNIVKHSQAGRASVTIQRERQNIVLTIKDDGHGFDTSEVKGKQGLGLNGITERVKMLGGTFLIESEIGKGTTVLVEIESEASAKQISV